MPRSAVCALALSMLSACASQSGSVPSNVTFNRTGPMPAPIAAHSGAPPRIVAIRFSGDHVRRGQTWSGTIITTTNVASVEVRTNLFSINVPRHKFGDFRFTLRVYDVPPIFIRAYRLRVLARNAAGEAVEEDVPFRIR
jgi:hypothetical protein